MKEVIQRAKVVADTKSTVLITGETGTGKELIARAIHDRARSATAALSVNCAAMPESLLESELFGHVNGAFTGAIDNKTGRFEAAHGGTIFLDEIDSMSPKLQVKLLRVLQEREFEHARREPHHPRRHPRDRRHQPRAADRRDRAASFRDDLYYRLNVLPIYLPPLRERARGHPGAGRITSCRSYARRTGRDPPELPTGVLTGCSSTRLAGQRPRAGELHRAGGGAGGRPAITTRAMASSAPRSRRPGLPCLSLHTTWSGLNAKPCAARSKRPAVSRKMPRS